MKTFKLNPEQIYTLIKKRYINIKENESIEIQGDNLIYYNTGNISKIHSITLQFKENNISENQVKNL